MREKTELFEKIRLMQKTRNRSEIGRLSREAHLLLDKIAERAREQGEQNFVLSGKDQKALAAVAKEAPRQ